MEIALNNKLIKPEFRFELTPKKHGMRIWGSRMSYLWLHEKLNLCWDCEEEGMSQTEAISHIGVISYFSYSVRHAFMGDRLVTIDGKPLRRWTDELFRIFEDEKDRFEVGTEFSWPQMLFIMAAWWECYRHQHCPSDLLPILMKFTENMERILLSRSKRDYIAIEPYLHGAIYAANPYLMHYMEHVNREYLFEVYIGHANLKQLADELECSSYGTYFYRDYLSKLKRQAKRLGCQIEEMKTETEDYLYELQL